MTKKTDWRALEKSVAVGDRWRFFRDGETCNVAALDGGTVLCTSGICYPIAALVRTARRIGGEKNGRQAEAHEDRAQAA